MLHQRKTASLCTAFLFSVAALAHAQIAKPISAPSAGLSAPEIAGLYQMVDPRGVADPITTATFLRLLPDGRSRLEAVMVSDISGAITSRTEVGQYHRDPW